MSARPPFAGEVLPEPLVRHPDAQTAIRWTARELRTVNNLLERVQSGFGGLRQTGYNPGTYTSGAWLEVEFDEQIISGSFRTDVVVAGNSIALLVPGVWELKYTFALDHDSLNGGRTLSLRLVGDGTPLGAAIVYGIGRNQDTTNIVGSTLLDTSQLPAGVEMTIEIGDAQGGNVAGSLLRGAWYATQLATL